MVQKNKNPEEEFFNHVVDRTKSFISNNVGEFFNTAFIFDEQTKEIKIIPLDYGEYTKEEFKQKFKKFLLTGGFKKYIIAFDTKMTANKINSKDFKNAVVYDAIIMTYYTPKTKKCIIYQYKESKNPFFKPKTIKMNGRKGQADEWDLWNLVDRNKPELRKMDKQYQEFKEQNKREFKGMV